MSTSGEKRRTCPCKRIPMCLSSFTAAEYGDLHSLQRSATSTTSRSSVPIGDRVDSGGCTPLHLAAQNNHVAATSLLLELGAMADNNQSGATPLHRASYSGAIHTMRLLVDERWHCDLLAQDTSFGDRMTPLHKAAAGGRHLAVKLLLHALRTRQNDAGTNNMLQTGLEALDSMHRTPLEVALHFSRNQGEEQKSVRRWDVVAGGEADWKQCVQLLKAAESDIRRGNTCSAVENYGSCLPALPKHLSEKFSCLNCENGSDGTCLTASWEAAFRSALSSSVSRSGLTRGSIPEPLSQEVSNSTSTSRPEETSISELTARATIENEKCDEASVGRKCELCGVQSFALYPSGDGKLVCRSCFRPKRRLRVQR